MFIHVKWKKSSSTEWGRRLRWSKWPQEIKPVTWQKQKLALPCWCGIENPLVGTFEIHDFDYSLSYIPLHLQLLWLEKPGDAVLLFKRTFQVLRRRVNDHLTSIAAWSLYNQKKKKEITWNRGALWTEMGYVGSIFHIKNKIQLSLMLQTGNISFSGNQFSCLKITQEDSNMVRQKGWGKEIRRLVPCINSDTH